MQAEKPSKKEITEDEAALYDRQIRLWGVDAQARLRNANVLIVGSSALVNETCKNLVLAGVGSLTIWDKTLVQPADLGAHFYLNEFDIGKEVGSSRGAAMLPALQQLNPRVKLSFKACTLSEEPNEGLLDFDIILLVDAAFSQIIRLDRLCRHHSIHLLTASAPGLYGFIFIDLGTYSYFVERAAQNGAGEKVKETLVEEYPSLDEALAFSWSALPLKKLRKFVSPLLFSFFAIWRFQEKNGTLPTTEDLPVLRQDLGIPEAFVAEQVLQDLVWGLGTEYTPTCAIVGGVLAQEAIKIITHKELPVDNFFLYNARDGSGVIHHVPHRRN
ncbi:hypothetical protein BJ684DRAFT_16153 [Piptocephalis cylindrospora]|uniref:Ubiquitin-like 1-activating enzyme E1A n=1 Tax=Piptocephalis cylindrospora TaxID=1907219 RepID=A0A4V1IY62_9FUNG|nr:hypothetical protein BJ684DRAFT_16153 [Piptocephalis cylindrospora]|eukprot:RKP13449.1 hypothetical protein BJ684DRAFT_16153 [Piptocephalis cylindrospora]